MAALPETKETWEIAVLAIPETNCTRHTDFKRAAAKSVKQLSREAKLAARTLGAVRFQCEMKETARVAYQSSPTSRELAECVKAPALIRSTPVAAIAAIVVRLTPPEASSSTCGAI